MEGIFFAIVLLVGVVRALYRFFQWVARSVRGTSAPAPVRPSTPVPVNTPTGTGVPKGLSLPRPTVPAPRPSAMPRRPEAGGPAVLRETSREEFQRQEDEALADEPRSLRTLDNPPPGPPATPRRPLALPGSPNDLVRAVILQEVLGPPHSRRPR